MFERFGKAPLLFDPDPQSAGNGFHIGENLAPQPGFTLGQVLDGIG